MRSALSFVVAGCMVCAGVPTLTRADAGPLGIDRRITYDDSGIWKRRNQVALEVLAPLVVASGARWLGDDEPLGHTFWQSLDATVFSSTAAAVLKPAFGRARPTQTDNPNEWFKGPGHNSFPSGEVTEISGAVTPFVLEYGPQHPAVYALELLPLYDAVARVKARAHWQTDVLASFALGTGLGVYAHGRASALSVSVLPGGFSVGWRKQF
jgi:hypothetical protein